MTGTREKPRALIFDLDGVFFDTGTTADDVSNLKPNPETYLKRLNALGTAPGDCLALEDSPTGIEAAKAAGLYTLGDCSSYGPERLTAADEIFPDTTSARRGILEAFT